MSISPIAPGAVSAQPVQPQEQTPAPAQAPVQAKPAPAKDVVTISKQAAKLASDGDSAAVEIKEGAAEKANESLRGKK